MTRRFENLLVTRRVPEADLGLVLLVRHSAAAQDQCAVVRKRHPVALDRVPGKGREQLSGVAIQYAHPGVFVAPPPAASRRARTPRASIYCFSAQELGAIDLRRTVSRFQLDQARRRPSLDKAMVPTPRGDWYETISCPLDKSQTRTKPGF